MSRFERQCSNSISDMHQHHLLVTDQVEFSDSIIQQLSQSEKFKSILFARSLPYESKVDLKLDKFLSDSSTTESVKVAVTLKPCGPERLLSAIQQMMTDSTKPPKEVISIDLNLLLQPLNLIFRKLK